MMKSMIITPNSEDPEVQILSNELKTRGYNVQYFIPSTIRVGVGFQRDFYKQFEDLEPKAALVRGFGAAATQKIFFRLDILPSDDNASIFSESKKLKSGIRGIPCISSI